MSERSACQSIKGRLFRHTRQGSKEKETDRHCGKQPRTLGKVRGRGKQEDNFLAIWTPKKSCLSDKHIPHSGAQGERQKAGQSHLQRGNSCVLATTFGRQKAWPPSYTISECVLPTHLLPTQHEHWTIGDISQPELKHTQQLVPETGEGI